jgi:hypothetical protein
VARALHGEQLCVLWRRREVATLDDVVELLHGLSVIVQAIDAKLERIVSLLEENDSGETGS